MSRPSGSPMIVTSSRPPAHHRQANARGEAEPDRRTDRAAPDRGGGLERSGRDEEQGRAQEEDRDRQGDPEHDAADPRELPEREAALDPVDAALDCRALADGRLLA